MISSVLNLRICRGRHTCVFGFTLDHTAADRQALCSPNKLRGSAWLGSLLSLNNLLILRNK